MARLRNKLMTGENKADVDDNVLNVAKNLPLFIDRVEKILDGQVLFLMLPCSSLPYFLPSPFLRPVPTARLDHAIPSAHSSRY